ncbi:hypothetical protein [Psychromicrobium xiongbiense]|uniref:hypothetical protein n=1 Tax=Psychromicrobium xiongbiense TaxID=3051184 RepID=UPI0025527C5E|nr:hypothetical protein [Psychromicrobium sp. YIM S02556]
MASNQPQHENSTVQSAFIFAIFMILFLAGIFCFTWGSLNQVWPFALGLGLIFLAFWIPQTLMGRSDSGAKAMVKTDHRKPNGNF